MFVTYNILKFLRVIWYFLSLRKKPHLFITFASNSFGKRIKTFVNKKHPVGRYIVKWDDTNDLGIQITSGTYLYRIVTDKDFMKLHKMMFLKIYFFIDVQR